MAWSLGLTQWNLSRFEYKFKYTCFQFQRFSLGLQPLKYTLKYSQLISSSDNKKNLVDNQKCQAGFRPLFNKILIIVAGYCNCTLAFQDQFFIYSPFIIPVRTWVSLVWQGTVSPSVSNPAAFAGGNAAAGSDLLHADQSGHIPTTSSLRSFK